MAAVPEWCSPPRPLLERDAALTAAGAMLRERGAVALLGARGVGTTVVAGALLVEVLDRPLVCLRVDATLHAEDLVLGIGESLGAELCADHAEVQRRAAQAIVLLDDADLAPEAVREVMKAIPARYVLTGRSFPPTLDIGVVSVAPLTNAAIATLLPPGVDPKPFRGLPALVACQVTPGGDDPWTGLESLPPTVEILADMPSGTPSAAISGVPAAVCLPIPGRTVLRRCVRESMGGGDEPSSESLAAALRDRLDSARAIASDVPLRRSRDDLAFMRTASWRVADPDLAGLAAAAAARIYLAYAAPAEAIEVARHALLERPPADALITGLLRWVEGDALFDRGDEVPSLEIHRLAWEKLAPVNADLAARLARRVAAAHAARGSVGEARRWLALARRSADPADPFAAADVQRLSGDIAMAAGELVSAATLYEEADAALERNGAPGSARIAVLLGRAGIELAQGQLAAAEQLVDRAARNSDGEPALMAAIAVRRAEVRIRRGMRREALSDLDGAISAAATCGAMSLSIVAHRLRGDALSLSGEPDAAVLAWRRALELACRARDLDGARRVLRRLGIIEREGLGGPHLGELLTCTDLGEVLARMHGR